MANDEQRSDAGSTAPRADDPSDAAIEAAEAAVATPDEPGAKRRGWRPSGSFWLVAAIVVVGLTAALSVWVWVSEVAPVPTPALVSLTPPEADKVLHDAGLAAGNATYEVTQSYAAGEIIAQSPLPYVRVPRGTSVNVRVATAPKAITVPNVVGGDTGYARNFLEYVLLKPVVLYAYSKNVRSNSVMEQLPRAGDTAMTGSPEVLFVSLGPGVPGAVVPDMKGLPFAKASQVASASTLFAQPRAVVATGTATGTVVDQAPSAGAVVPVASVVWVSVAAQ